jgi:hypothetical protein
MKRIGVGMLILASLLMAGSVEARELRVVEGLIEDTGKTLIRVRGRHYDLTAVPIHNPSGRSVSILDLRRGQRVEILFERNRIISVVVHEINLPD